MSQNMLPFELDRARLFGRCSAMYLKMIILRFSHSLSFRRANGLIFLTNYARRSIISQLGKIKNFHALIPHGIEDRFCTADATKMKFVNDVKSSIRLLYVSVKLPYKHHIEVMHAVAELRRHGFDIEIDIVGGDVGLYGDKVKITRKALDPAGKYLHDFGHVEFSKLHELYQEADIFLYASSCENLPNILIEAMASGLPIACSNRGPMSEIVRNAAVYFDPESVPSISEAIKKLVDDPLLRKRLAKRASIYAKDYSWENCSYQTFNFLSQVAAQKKKGVLSNIHEI